MESVIWAFKQIYDKGYIYKGKRVSLFSTDTSTPVSNFEVAMDADNYRDIEDLSIFVRFALRDTKQIFNIDSPISIVAWTTTPWTIPSNFALAVNPALNYCLVEYESEFYILAKNRLQQTFKVTEDDISEKKGTVLRIVKEMKGAELEGLSYEPVYQFFVETKKESDFKVYLHDGVSEDDGTGVLHVAPAFGEEDYNLGIKFGLSDKSDIDEEGKMIVGPWEGLYLRNASELITEDLKVKGNLLRSEMYTHRLPFYRGENPLIYMAQEAYFINIQKIKERMVELSKDITWVPDWIKEGRFSQTLATSPDWCISRSRYWATVMPIWRSDDGDEIVVGSFEEMLQYTDQVVKIQKDGKDSYLFEGKPMDLHRDICDKIIFIKEGKEYRRIPEVLDGWMDSGSVPFAEHHYPFENKEEFEKSFPADYIIEYVGQVRAWFNVLLRISTMIFDDNAFINVICTGVMAGNDGRKMSKSFGNYPDPKDVLENVGGEALRLYLMGSPIMSGNDLSWSDEILNDQVKNVLIPLWNTYKYFTIYADLHDWTPSSSDFNSTNILDIWLETYVKNVTFNYAKELEAYHLPESVKLIQPCLESISSWWIRRSRDRFVEGDKEALQTLYAALVHIIKTFAPQMAFLSEEIYQNIVVNVLEDAKESVHLEFFPEVVSSDIDTVLLTNMELVREICSLGLSARVENSLKLRQPLNKAVIKVNGDIKLNDPLLAIIQDELNVKAITITSGELGEDSSNFVVKNGESLSVLLDIQITPELQEEGFLAEVKRQLQNFRKVSGLQMGEKALLQLSCSDTNFVTFITKYQGQILQDISLSSIEFVENLDGDSLKLEGFDVKAKILK
jgi:isoleucyl-tRNA synthetase